LGRTFSSHPDFLFAAPFQSSGELEVAAGHWLIWVGLSVPARTYRLNLKSMFVK
jgi:hypothetical protein